MGVLVAENLAPRGLEPAGYNYRQAARLASRGEGHPALHGTRHMQHCGCGLGDLPFPTTSLVDPCSDKSLSAAD